MEGALASLVAVDGRARLVRCKVICGDVRASRSRAASAGKCTNASSSHLIMKWARECGGLVTAYRNHANVVTTGEMRRLREPLVGR